MWVSILLQPSVSGMDPPFGDAFRSHVFAEQTLMSTDLLASSSDPDFMYELVGHPSVCVCAELQEVKKARRLFITTHGGRTWHSTWVFLCHSALMLVQQTWCSLNRCSLKLAFRRGLISNRAVLTLHSGAWDSSSQCFLQEQLYAASPKLWMQGKQNKSWLMSY